jgi:diacylglycerol kinase family enzyme
MSSTTIQIRNDVDVVVRGLKDRRTKEFLNAATGTWELRTAKVGSGAQVSSGVMGYVSDSNGEYAGGIDNALTLTEGTTYWLHVELDEGGVVFDAEIPVVAVRRIGVRPNG